MTFKEGEPVHCQHIFPVVEYESQASRIEGFQELFRYGLRAPTPMFILGHGAFTAYCEAGYQLPDQLKEEIGQAYEAMRTANPTRGPYIGRAFYIPGIDNPNGPRTAAIWDKDQYLEGVTRFYQFVLDHEYNVGGADIALVFHPFISALEKRERYGGIEIGENELPFSAGYAVPESLPGRETQIRIIATFGSDEAVQSCPSDSYLVDSDRGTIFAKEVVLKTHTYVPVSGSTYVESPIPPRFQSEQALTDEEAIAVAREATKVFGHRPQSRIEFIMQPDGIYVREIAPYALVSEHRLFTLPAGKRIVASVIRVESETDISKISGPEAIVFFPPEAFRSRTTDLFALVASLPTERLVALVYGTLATSHMAKVLAEAGRSVILVRDTDFPEGEQLSVSSDAEGHPVVEYLDSYHDTIVPFSDVQKHAHRVAGNKVARLAIMRNAGIPVPDGFGITSQGVWQFLKDISAYEAIASLDRLDLSSWEELGRITEAIRQKILASPLPSQFAKKIQVAVAGFGFAEYAVRSSGSEDGEGQSQAGLYQSSLRVKPQEVEEKVKETIASYFSPASILTVRQRGQLPSQLILGVGVQEYIPALPGTVGAVAFTNSPLAEKDNIIQVDIAGGSPEAIVSGTAEDYWQVFVDRESGQIRRQQVGNPDFTVAEETVREIITVSMVIEELFQSYQDIELIVTPGEEGEEANDLIVVVQARPL